MKETQFVKQNQQKWRRFEQILKSGRGDSEEISNLFVEVTDDLSYARTFYPNRSVRVYLNGVAQKVFNSVYKNRTKDKGRFLRFWGKDTPHALYQAKGELVLSLGVFLLAVLIGVVSSLLNPEFPVVVLGEGYVEQTYRNIASGQPMSVYQQQNETDMFLMIAYNNLRVAGMTFLLGLLGGLGTLYILLFNGVMIGAFQTLFIQEGVYWESILTIWVHGTIEISCIIVAGAAGLTLGRGLLFPKTFTRIQSLQLAAQRGVKIMLSLIPLILLAAFIEGFITRYTNAPYLLRGGIIFVSLAFVLLYFVWLPWRVGRKLSQAELAKELQLPPSNQQELNFLTLQNSSDIFSAVITVYRRYFKEMVVLGLFVAGIYTSILLFQAKLFWINLGLERHWIENMFMIFERSAQFIFAQDALIANLNILLWAIPSYWLLHRLQQEYAKSVGQTASEGKGYYLSTALITLAVMGIVCNLLASLEEIPAVGFLLAIFVIPILFLWVATTFNERMNPFSSLGHTFAALGNGNYNLLLSSSFIVLLMSILLMFFTTAPLTELYFTVIVTLFPVDSLTLQTFHQGFYVFLNVFCVSLIVPLLVTTPGVGYFAFRETTQATALQAEIEQLGKRRKSYGMERE